MDNITLGSFDTSFNALLLWAFVPVIFYWAFVDKKKSFTSLGVFGKTVLSLWTLGVFIKAVKNQTTVAEVLEITFLLGIVGGYVIAILFKFLTEASVEKAELESKRHKQEEADKELIRKAARKILES